MKISKLFHWLYAMVMFLPLFAIGITCAYVVFNKNAKDSYYGETINEVNYNVISNTNALKINSVYNLKSNAITPIQNLTVSTNSLNVENVVLNSEPSTDLSNIRRISFFNNYSQSSPDLYVYFYDETGTNITSRSSYDLDFTFLGIRQDINNVLNTLLSQENNLFEIEYNKYSFLDNAFYYSVHELKNNHFFNWAKSSFLAQPITYITDLFGMDSDNFVIYLLSYWLDISIIWLTFDVVMYVPLLVHRWLDKGVLE